MADFAQEQSRLWGGIPLPTWGDAAPRRLYDLFLLHNHGRLTRGEEDDYLRLLMVLLAMRFAGRGWTSALREKGLEAADVAQAGLARLHRKSGPGGSLRLGRVQYDGWRVLLRALYTSIDRIVLEAVKSVDRRQTALRIATATDHFRGEGRSGEPAGVAELANLAGPATCDGPTYHALAVWLGSEEADDQLIGDLTGTAAEAETFARLSGTLRGHLLAAGALLAYDRLPEALRSEVCCELHALVSFRLARAVGDFAGSHCPCG